MALTIRVTTLVLVVAALVGCETIPIPQERVPDTFPASGPTGLRLGLAYMHNAVSDDAKVGGRFSFLNGKDTTDLWSNGYGGFIEIPIDVNPFFGGFFGFGGEAHVGETTTRRIGGGEFEVGRSSHKVGDLQLIPMYIGLTARLPFWLDWDAWKQETNPIWLPNAPIGPAVYLTGRAGGAWTATVPRIYLADGSRTRAIDYQVIPFAEGAVGTEYRHKEWGLWAELGYRHYEIDAGRTGLKLDGVGGLRVHLGLSWYGF